MRRLRGEKAEQETTNECGRVAGPAAFYFLCLFVLAAKCTNTALPGYLRHRTTGRQTAKIASVKRIPWNAQLMLVAGGYAAALAISALLIVLRYFQYATHPLDVAAYGGMWAGGDLMLEVFICGMFLVVTFFLMLVIAKSEAAYTIYAKVLLGVSLTMPFSVAVVSISAMSSGDSIFGWACLFRLFASPIVLFGIGLSRLFARFPRAKKLTLYALLVESATLFVMVALLFSPIRFGHS